MRRPFRPMATALRGVAAGEGTANVVTAGLLAIAALGVVVVVWQPFSDLVNAMLVCGLMGVAIPIAGSAQFASGNLWHPLALPGTYAAATLTFPLLYVVLLHLSLGAVKPSELTASVPIVFALTLGGLLVGTLVGLAPQRQATAGPTVEVDSARLLWLGRAMLVAAALIRLLAAARTYGRQYGTGLGTVQSLASSARTLDTFAALTVVAGAGLIAVANVRLRHRVIAWPDVALLAAFAIPTLASGSRGELLAPAILLAWAHNTLVRRIRVTHVLASCLAVVVVFQGVAGLRAGGSFLGGMSAAVERTLGSVGTPVFITDRLVQNVPSAFPFTNGSTYVAALERQLPGPVATKIFGPPTGTGTFVFRRILHYANPNNGFAFALPSEGYLNFGLEGALLAGGAIGLLLGWAYRQQSDQTVTRARHLLYPVAVAALPESLRSDAVASMKLILYPMLVLALAFYLARREVAHAAAASRYPRATVHPRLRRHVVVTVVTIVALSVPALVYGSVLANQETINRPELTARLAAAAGFPLEPGPNLAGRTEIDWVAAGGSERESLSVIVCTTPAAARRLAAAPATESNPRLLQRGRVVVLYTRRDGAPDRAPEIRAILRTTVPAT